ncbi:nitrate ABC transporter ATP-binding protein [Alkalinema sp. FACHB-956]|uniref:nitrate ABC transporter ATP-binding protein n=1 Tax=Alkalinema sp. FACHB-956 TaxID=2692768 RepID=UPI0016856F78|nr:nitrate ABC transporter ATP-binding protein [Alkalinema sp. FACHB-956]MBD2326023.1 ATP-binding cassette domain-containing protein [Alkalinema sp. FACHB-956]
MTYSIQKPKNAAPDQTAPFLVLDGVTKVYPTASGPNVVIKGINLEVKEGEFICLIGHSGCGKSTLLNTISGFADPNEGEVRKRGQKITKPGPDRMVVFQNYSLMPWLSAYDNVYLALDSVHPNKSKAEKDHIVQEHLVMVGLGDAMDKKPPQLSGGMRQRVAIARAFCLRPEVLILDEPFGALDAITKEEMQEELSQIFLDHKCTILMVTHDIDECLFLADRLVMMTNGPAAGIGEILDIPFPRPRDRAQILEDPRYYDLRNRALDFLYNRFAHDDISV